MTLQGPHQVAWKSMSKFSAFLASPNWAKSLNSVTDPRTRFDTLKDRRVTN